VDPLLVLDTPQERAAYAYGNIQYGAMANMFNIALENAIGASNQPASGGQATGDDMAVGLGYSLVDAYPQGMNESQFTSWFNSGTVQDQLRAAGRVR